MTTSLERIEPGGTDVELVEPRRTSRRYALMTVGSAFVAGLATLLNAKPAAADCQGSPCCSLASCTICYYEVSKDRWKCPPGYYRTYWTCVSGSGITFGCGECSAGPSCWTGPFACSVWFHW